MPDAASQPKFSSQPQAAYHFERERADKRWMVQPLGGGPVTELSWKQGMDQARRVASYLKSLDLPPRSQVAILSKNTAWWILADLAIWMAGHVSVPIYPNLPPEQIQQILEHSESKLIFVGKLDGWEAMAPGVPEAMPRVLTPLNPESAAGERWEDILKAHEPMSESPEPDADDLATIVYTSGSTGTPKGVMHSFRTMCASQEGLDSVLTLEADERMLSYLPLAHVFERWVVETGTFLQGFELYFAESITTFVQDLQRARPTLFVSVPRLWLKFQQGVSQKLPPARLALLLKIPIVSGIIKKKVLGQLGLDAVRFAGSGSAPIPGPLIDWYRSLGLQLLEGYGMSENFCYSHVNRPGRVRVGFVGETYPSVDCRVSEEGEILVRGPGTMMGYFKAPELTAKVVDSEGWLYTGDRGEIDEQGRLKITGRVKELFKTSKGKYVAPAPIENEVLLHAEVESACVTGSGLPQPLVLVNLTEGAEQRAGGREALQRSLEQHLVAVNPTLAHHEQLSTLVVIPDEWTPENGMLTPTLKLKRVAIDGRYGPSLEEWDEVKQTVVFA